MFLFLNLASAELGLILWSVVNLLIIISVAVIIVNFLKKRSRERKIQTELLRKIADKLDIP